MNFLGKVLIFGAGLLVGAALNEAAAQDREEGDLRSMADIVREKAKDMGVRIEDLKQASDAAKEVVKEAKKEKDKVLDAFNSDPRVTIS